MLSISIVKFSIMLNGTSIDFFGSTRGVCQGNSLFPLLFGIVIEALSRMLDATAILG